MGKVSIAVRFFAERSPLKTRANVSMNQRMIYISVYHKETIQTIGGPDFVTAEDDMTAQVRHIYTRDVVHGGGTILAGTPPRDCSSHTFLSRR